MSTEEKETGRQRRTHLTDRPAAPGVWPSALPSTIGELEAEAPPALCCAAEKRAGRPTAAAAAAAAADTAGEWPRACWDAGWGGAGEFKLARRGDHENWLGLKNLWVRISSINVYIYIYNIGLARLVGPCGGRTPPGLRYLAHLL
jgi:hypothetical protein